MLKFTVLLPLLAAACCVAMPAGDEPAAPAIPVAAALAPADQAADVVSAESAVREGTVVDPALQNEAGGRPLVVSAEGDAEGELLGGAESRYGRHRWGGYGGGYGGWGGYGGGYGRGYGGWGGYGGYGGYGYGRGYGGWGGYGWGGYGGYRRGGWW